MSGNTNYVIRIANTPEDIEKCMQIRKEVFIDEQGYDISIETNDDDYQSTHFLMISNKDEPIGTIRLINNNNQLGRFAIMKTFRSKGFGKPLIEFVHEHVRNKGGVEIWCQSQAANPNSGGIDATGFYKKMGYVNKGELYMKEGTQHQDMVYYLKH
ncbi:uncharacterized protein I206_101305 [Kwoniella pini CBS 10737]|uniref:N-acetyltransferase domain-containing protein n=1 Tax=Kwoniella pini CBS 10737 TaxID=1296096 RepID=A0A1B9IBA3_9TREE|nr:uncharacterized protein I206_00019 [Kwoniella pini CBS 10737]OCF52723.1 hypothetical protein I206_00019 [Kwoniella pini CBS 10737]